MKKSMAIREAVEICKPRGFVRLEKLTYGSLWLRKEGNGVLKFYWRVTYKNKTKQNPIGRYDSSAQPKSTKATEKGYSLAAARKTAEDMAARARPGLGVSVPISWEELPMVGGGAQWTISSIDERVAVGNSPWTDAAAQPLGPSMKTFGYAKR